ncbi:MAG: glycosyltransferase [Candidatus Gracilibacteria bacterium]
MKIGLDLRFIDDNLYSAFTIELVKGLISQDDENSFILYTNSDMKGFDNVNTTIKNVGIKNFSLKEQTIYLRILKKDKNNLMLFFNHYKPIFYVGDYFTILPSLKDIYYSNFSNYFVKYSFYLLLDKNLKKSKNIICFDKNTLEELIEKYNIEENKIKYLQGFFPNSYKLSNTADLKIDIKAKYNIKNKFFIYSGGEGVEKNYEKLIYVFNKMKKAGLEIDLVFLGGTISRNLFLRNIILKLEMQKNIHFMGVIKPAEKILFYKDSMGTIFSSFYEPFPFYLTEPLYFDIPIISSDLKNVKDIFNDTIHYFSPISVNSIYEEIKLFLKKENVSTNYDNVKQKYSKENTIKQLLEIIR